MRRIFCGGIWQTITTMTLDNNNNINNKISRVFNSFRCIKLHDTQTSWYHRNITCPDTQKCFIRWASFAKYLCRPTEGNIWHVIHGIGPYGCLMKMHVDWVISEWLAWHPAILVQVKAHEYRVIIVRMVLFILGWNIRVAKQNQADIYKVDPR